MSNELKVQRDDGRFKLAGSITETSDFKPILEGATPGAVLDLAGVERINSCGVREWIHLLEALEKNGNNVVLENCAVPMVRQFNMIRTATRGATVKSVMVPYYCETCDDEKAVAADVAAEPATDAKCPTCGSAMEFDDDADAYFAFRR